VCRVLRMGLHVTKRSKHVTLLTLLKVKCLPHIGLTKSNGRLTVVKIEGYFYETVTRRLSRNVERVS